MTEKTRALMICLGYALFGYAILGFGTIMPDAACADMKNTSAPPYFTTKSGDNIAIHDATMLSCDKIVKLLDQIDASGYRGAAPTPQQEADKPLFTYEQALGHEHFKRCMIGGDATHEGTSAAFQRAFTSDKNKR